MEDKNSSKNSAAYGTFDEEENTNHGNNYNSNTTHEEDTITKRNEESQKRGKQVQWRSHPDNMTHAKDFDDLDDCEEDMNMNMKQRERTLSYLGDEFDNNLLQGIVQDTGKWAYGTVIVEVWVMNKYKTHLVLVENGGYWIDPKFCSRYTTDKEEDDDDDDDEEEEDDFHQGPSKKQQAEAIDQLKNPSNPEYIPPDPVSAGVGLPGILWSELHHAAIRRQSRMRRSSFFSFMSIPRVSFFSQRTNSLLSNTNHDSIRSSNGIHTSNRSNKNTNHDSIRSSNGIHTSNRSTSSTNMISSFFRNTLGNRGRHIFQRNSNRPSSRDNHPKQKQRYRQPATRNRRYGSFFEKFSLDSFHNDDDVVGSCEKDNNYTNNNNSSGKTKEEQEEDNRNKRIRISKNSMGSMSFSSATDDDDDDDNKSLKNENSSRNDSYHHYGSNSNNKNRIVWRHVPTISNDPHQQYDKRLQLLSNCGIGLAAAVPFYSDPNYNYRREDDDEDRRNYQQDVEEEQEGIVVYMTKVGIDSKKLKSYSNETYLLNATKLIGLTYMLRISRKRAIQERHKEFQLLLSNATRKINIIQSLKNNNNSDVLPGMKEGTTDKNQQQKGGNDTTMSKIMASLCLWNCNNTTNTNHRKKHYKLRGYIRKMKGAGLQPPPSFDLEKSLFAGFGVFVTLLILTKTNEYIIIPYFGNDYSVSLASYGAFLTLVFGLTAAPAAQPLSTMGGQLIAMVIAICVSNMPIMYIQNDDSMKMTLATSLTIFAMVKIGVTHPPAGATSVRFATGEYSYKHIFFTLLGQIIAIIIASIINNLNNERQYPTYWGFQIVKDSFDDFFTNYIATFNASLRFCKKRLMSIKMMCCKQNDDNSNINIHDTIADNNSSMAKGTKIRNCESEESYSLKVSHPLSLFTAATTEENREVNGDGEEEKLLKNAIRTNFVSEVV